MVQDETQTIMPRVAEIAGLRIGRHPVARLGIGVNTVVFSEVNALILRDMPGARILAGVEALVAHAKERAAEAQKPR